MAFHVRHTIELVDSFYFQSLASEKFSVFVSYTFSFDCANSSYRILDELCEKGCFTRRTLIRCSCCFLFIPDHVQAM